MKNLPLILEAERRGVIRSDDQAFLAEGRRRNLPEFGSIVAEKPKQSIAEWEAENSPRGRQGHAGWPGIYLESQPETMQTDVPKSPYRRIEEAVERTPLSGVTEAVGLVDLGLEMGSSFLIGAPTGAVAGVVNVYQEDGGVFKWKNWEKYAPMFHHISEALTLKTSTKSGQKASEGLAKWIVKHIDDALIEKWLVEPNMKEGQENPLAALLGKVSGEMLKLVLPLKLARIPGQIKRVRARKDFAKRMDKKFPSEASPMEEKVLSQFDRDIKYATEMDRVSGESGEPFPAEKPQDTFQIEPPPFRPEPPTSGEQFGPPRRVEKPTQGLEAQDIPFEEPVKPPSVEPAPKSPYADEIIFQSNKANAKHNNSLSVARKWETPEKLEKQTKDIILEELAIAGVRVKDPTAPKSALARSLFDHIDSSRRRAKSIEKRSPGTERFDREKRNEQERLAYITGKYGGVDATEFREYGGTMGEDGFIHTAKDIYNIYTAKRTTKRSKRKDDYSKKIKTPGLQEWVEPLVENGGRGLDQIHKSMIEDGHIPRDMDVSEFYELLRQDMEGNKVYSDLATDRVNSRAGADFESFYKEEIELYELAESLKPGRGEVLDYMSLAKQTYRKEKIQGPVQPGATLDVFPNFNRFGNLSKVLDQSYQKLKNTIFKKPDRRIVVHPEWGDDITVKGMALNALRGIMSPNQAAKIFKVFEPYFKHAKVAENTQQKISQMVHKRIQSINDDLKVNPRYQKEYAELLLRGDLMSKEFTRAELTEMNVPANVQKAYLKTRSYFDHIYTMLSKHSASLGKDAITRETGYLPHFFHDWFIRVDGKMIPTAKTWAEAVSRSNKILQENPNAKIRIFPKQGDLLETYSDGKKYKPTIGDQDYLITQDNMIGKFEMDPYEASEMMNGLFKMPKRQRFLGQLLDRKGVMGWEKDIGFMVQHYGNITGRYIALDRFKKSVGDQAGGEGWRLDVPQEGIRKYIRDYINDINGNPTALESLLMRSPIFQKKGIIGMYISGDRPLMKIASGATSTMAITKLGLYNVSAAVVNASQVMNTNALLGPKFTKIGLEKAKLWDKGKMSGKDKGIVRQLLIEEQLGLEHDALMGNVHSAGKIFNATTKWFQGVEQFNRRTAGLGAYYKFIAENPANTFGILAKGKNNMYIMQHKAAIASARETIYRSQFDYGLYDAHGFIRRTGPLGSVLFQFKKFPIKQAEFMLGLKGAEAKRFWATYGLAVGLMGFPGMDLIVNLVKQQFDTDIELETMKYLNEWTDAGDSEMERAARKRISEVVMYGLPSQANLNISARVGTRDIIPQSLSDLAGPTLSTISRMREIFSEERDGKWAKVVKNMATSLGNVYQAAEGATYNKRGRKITEFTPQEQVVKSMGFRTMRETKEVNAQNVIRYDERKSRALKAKYVDRAIMAIKNDEQGDLKEIAQDYASDNLGTAKSFVRAIMREMGQKQLTAGQRQFYNQSKLGKYRNLPTYKSLEK